MIGVFAIAFAFAEGTGNDWVAIATTEGHGTVAAVGTLAFALFLSAMTLAIHEECDTPWSWYSR